MSADVRTSKFRPLELNERNVNTLFKRCLPDEEELRNRDLLKNAQVLIPQFCGKESEKVFLSKKKTQDYRMLVLYLLGQIKVFNENNAGFALQEGFLRYDDVFWTKDYDVLFKLYSMGLASNCLTPFVPTEEFITSAAIDELAPTLSPKDPSFEEWYAKYIEEHPELF